MLRLLDGMIDVVVVVVVVWCFSTVFPLSSVRQIDVMDKIPRQKRSQSTSTTSSLPFLLLHTCMVGTHIIPYTYK